jgi:hypothetical protein
MTRRRSRQNERRRSSPWSASQRFTRTDSAGFAPKPWSETRTSVASGAALVSRPIPRRAREHVVEGMLHVGIDGRGPFRIEILPEVVLHAIGA